MNLTVERFDATQAGPDELAAHLALARAAMAVDRPTDPAPTYESVVGPLTTAFMGRGVPLVWVAHRGGELVGKGVVSLPSGENSHLAALDMQVHPAHRRQGVGFALLRAMNPAVTAPDRTIATSWNVVADTPAARWAEKLGFRVVRRSVVSAIDLVTADRTLWEIEAPAGYRAEHWCGHAPDALLHSYAHARTAIEDAPLGDASDRMPSWTAARVREAEAEVRARNAEQRIVVAVHEPTAEVVGLTEVQFNDFQPAIGYQVDTAVLADHRGHGLGAFIKAEMLRRVVAERPAARRIHTANEASNTPALRMNQRVGYKPIRTAIVVETSCADLAERLR